MPTPKYFEFIKGWRANCNERDIFGFIREWYERVFDCFPPEKPMPALKVKIEYELLIRDWKEAQKVVPHLKIPEKVLKNYEASKNFKLNDLSGMIGHSTRLAIQQGEGTEEMVKAKAKDIKKTAVVAKKAAKQEAKVAKAEPKEKKMTVTGYYEHLFSTNKSMTDEGLAQEMRKQFPDKKKYTVADIKSVRGDYNRGKLSTQGGVAPAVKSIKYDTKQVEAFAKVAKEPIVSRTAVVKKMLGKPAVVVKKKIVIKKK